MLGIVAMAGAGGQTSGATCRVMLRAQPSVYIRGMVLCTLELCRFMAQSCSDLQIPAGPAWTNRTAGVEVASRSACSPSPAFYAPSPSPASQMRFSAVWSESEGKVQWAPIVPPVIVSVGCEELVPSVAVCGMQWSLISATDKQQCW